MVPDLWDRSRAVKISAIDAVPAIISRMTGSKTRIPTMEELTEALAAAGSAHHEYEQTALKGERDEEWAAFYTAYVLGRLGDFVKPSVLSGLLTEAPLTDNWAESAAAHVLMRIHETRRSGE